MSVPTRIGEDAPITLTAPQVAVYCVIELPPLLAGAVKAIVALVSPGVALVMAGAPGTPTVMVTLLVTRGAGV